MSFEDELSAYLTGLSLSEAPTSSTTHEAASGFWHIEQTLKEGEFETTQKVFIGLPAPEQSPEQQTEPGAVQESSRSYEPALLGPFIRKLISSEVGLGATYRQVMQAQRSGIVLAHIPYMYSCRELPGTLEVVMECVQGSSLEQAIHACTDARARTNLSEEIFLQVCDAVLELHEALPNPIIHRDLTPSNILLDAKHRVKVIDLGISRQYRSEQTADTTHFGTRGYAPPEQFGFGQTDVRSDVYALGELLHFCLTGKHPSELGEPSAALGPYAALIHKATQFSPAARYQSVRDFKAALIAAQQEAHASQAANYPADKSAQAAAPQASARTIRPRMLASLAAPSTHASEVSAPTPGLSEVVGRAWNLVLCTAMVVLLISFIGASFTGYAAHGLGEALVYYSLYWVVCLPMLGMWWYVLLDKRRLQQHLRFVVAWPTKRAAKSATVVSVALICAWIVLACIVFVGTNR